jgi:hypothetical protein
MDDEVRAGSTAGPPQRQLKRRKHLMDPNHPQYVRSEPDSARNLSRVQQWVASTLAVTTILHLSAGLVVASLYLPHPTTSSRIGLNVIAAAFGVIAVGSALLIHGRALASPWLLVGLGPGLFGIWLTLR